MIRMMNGLNSTQEMKNRYNDLIMDTFEFSFDRWFSLDLWDEDYESYNIVENGIMIANISAFKMKMLINGVERNCLQFGAVATRGEHRGKGLSRVIMEHISNLYPGVPAFLFGNDNVLDFYPKFGFRVAEEKQAFIKQEIHNEGEMIKLNIKDPKIDRYLKERKQFSGIFDCRNQYSVNWFHLIMGYEDNVFEIPKLGVMLVATQQGSTLTIHDIASGKPLSFSELSAHLYFKGVSTIKFEFNPDWLDFEYELSEYKVEDSTLFIKGDLGSKSGFIVPSLIRT
jgi:GNAT superfamily N-acetyltransferase